MRSDRVQCETHAVCAARTQSRTRASLVVRVAGIVFVACATTAVGRGQGVVDPAAKARVINLENQLKAAFLYNFGHYITWPDDDTAAADEPFVLGVVGTHGVAPHLERVAAVKKRKHADNGVERPVVVRKFKAAGDIVPVHILFVAKSIAAADVRKITADLAGQPVLLVGEDDAFLDNGGMINLGVKNERIHLSVALPALEKSQLKPDSRLLRITPEVRK